MSAAGTVELRRADRVESEHSIDAAVVDASGATVASAGDPELRTYWRSAAKPFQLLPFVAGGAVAAYGFGAREIAVMAASHNGERAHRDAAAAILTAAGLEERHLLCGAHLPEHEIAWRELALSGGRPTPLWNNCSGKHAGMLAFCRLRGWSESTYLEAEHPLQREILASISSVTGQSEAAIGLGVDGCGVPAFHLPLRGMARAYGRLAAASAGGDDTERALARIRDAIAEAPYFVAGTGRLCSRLPEVTGGRIVAKVGAAGIFCAALRDRGWGVALKVRDGSTRAAVVGLVALLQELEAVSAVELGELSDFAPGAVRNHAGRVVGEARATLRMRR